MVLPYPARKEIQNSRTFDRDVLVYATDPAAAFFFMFKGLEKLSFQMEMSCI